MVSSVSSLALRIAKKEEAEQETIVSIGVVQARLVTAQIINRTLAAYQRREPLNASGDLVPRLTPLLTDTMVAAHLKGQRSHDDIRPAELRLSWANARAGGLSLAVPRWKVFQVLDAVQQGKLIELLTKGTATKIDDKILEAVRRRYGDETAKQVASTEIPREQPDERMSKVLGKMADAGTVRDLRRRYGNYAQAIVGDAAKKVEPKLQETVNGLIADGTPLRRAIPILRQAFETLGLSPKGDYQLETIFRTQSQVAFQAGRWKSDQDPAVQKILWGYRYSTVGDSRVRPMHRALEGVTLPKNDSFWQEWWCPNGWNCRCTCIPLYMPAPIVKPPRFVPGTWQAIEPEPGFGFHAGHAFAA